MAEVMGAMMERAELERRIELLRLDEGTIRARLEQLDAEREQLRAALYRAIGARDDCEHWLEQITQE